MRTLIAGFGNVLRGDDGFGITVLDHLRARGNLPPGVMLLEVGTGGLQLAQALLDHYDRVIVVDAMSNGGPPGSLYVQRVESVEAARAVDLHLAVPAQALAVAQAMKPLPPEVYLVGCEPLETEELRIGLSLAVEEAVGRAAKAIDDLLTARLPVEVTP